MSNVQTRWPIQIILAMVTIAVGMLAVTVNVRFADQILDSSTGVFAVLCALIAVGRLAQQPLVGLTALSWSAVLVLAVIVAGAEFAEPLAQLKGHDFGLENIDDVLLVAAGPIGLWLTSRLHPWPIATQILLVLGLAAQLCGAMLDLSDDPTLAGFTLTLETAERYADFAQFLSLMFYFMAMWVLVGEGSWIAGQQGRTRAAAGQVGAGLRRPLRDSLYPPPFLVGWGLADSRSPAGRVHRSCNEALWSAADIPLSASNLGTIALWPLIASARAVKEIRRHGVAVRQLTGKSRARQFLEQVFIAVTYRITPRYYYIYEFYRPGRLPLATQYLMRYETKEIAYRLLYPVATEYYQPTPLKNKMEFARHCRVNDVRRVDIFMQFEGGRRVESTDLLQQLPEMDLFIKPVLGKGGGGCELWRYLGKGAYRNTHGEEHDAGSLAAHAADLSRNESYIIQRAVRNHRDLLDLSAGALCTVRLLSCRNEAGDFEVTCAAFRMSVNPTSPIDNFHAGGVAAAVDIATGRLGPATKLGVGGDFAWYDQHPLTAARIKDRQLPLWRETVELAVRAHRIFPDYALVGWDVAILDDGPCVIEGNRGPDVDIHQRTSRGPIGDGRFGELLAFNLENRPGAR